MTHALRRRAVRSSVAGLATILLLALFPELASSQFEFAPGDVIVKYRPGAEAALRTQTRALLSRPHAVRSLGLIGADHIHFDDVTTPQAIEILGADPSVAYVEPNYLIHADVQPNDPRFPEQYALHNTGQGGGYAGDDINAPEAWDLTTGDPNVRVGIIDTGIDYTHPDLADNIWTNPDEVPGNHRDDDRNGYVDDVHGYDFLNGDGDPMDDGFHGTHVAGTVGAAGNNGVGVTGVNWRCALVAIKFMDANGIGTEANAISCIQYAVTLGLRVTNNSWGNMPYSQAMQDAIAAAGAAGQLLVFAAGNNRRNNDLVPEYPSSYDSPYIVSVAATDARDLLATFSNYGPTSVDLGAPGWNILSTMPGATYQAKDGTSMAAPHVSGVAALVLARFPQATNLQIRQLILDSVDPISSLVGRVATEGRLNAFKTLVNGSVWLGVNDETRSGYGLVIAGSNPTRHGVALELSLGEPGPVTLSVFDVTGRRIRLLCAGPFGGGLHRLLWDGADDRGASASPGVYFVHARTPGGAFTRRVVIQE